MSPEAWRRGGGYRPCVHPSPPPPRSSAEAGGQGAAGSVCLGLPTQGAPRGLWAAWTLGLCLHQPCPGPPPGWASPSWGPFMTAGPRAAPFWAGPWPGRVVPLLHTLPFPSGKVWTHRVLMDGWGSPLPTLVGLSAASFPIWSVGPNSLGSLSPGPPALLPHPVSPRCHPGQPAPSWIWAGIPPRSQRSRGKHLAAPGRSPLSPTLPDPRRAPGAGPDLQTAAAGLRAPGSSPA